MAESKIRTLYYEIEARTEHLSGGLAAAEARLKKFADFVRAHPVASLGAIAATAALAAAAAIKMAAVFDAQMRRVAASIDGGVAKLDELKRGVTELSMKVPQSLEELAGGLREIVQVGGREMQEPVNALHRLKVVTEAATASGEDLRTIITATDDVLDAFGKTGNDAAEYLLRMTYAVAQGRVPLGELMQLMAQLAPLAQASGMSLEELVALLGAMKEKGLSNTIIVRGLRAQLGQVAEGADDAKAALERVGIRLEVQNGQWRILSASLRDEYNKATSDAITKTEALHQAFETMQGGNLSGWQMFWKRVGGFYMMYVGTPLGDLMARLTRPMSQAELDRFHGVVPGSGPPIPNLPGFPDSNRRPTVGPVHTGNIDFDNRGGVVNGPPATRVTPEQIARQREALQALQDQVDSLTSSTLDNANRGIDRLVANLQRANVPTAQWAGEVERLRQSLGIQGDLQSFSQGFDQIRERVDDLVAKHAQMTPEWIAQKNAIDEQVRSLESYMLHLQRGTREHRAARDLLSQMQELQQRITKDKGEEVDKTKQQAAADKERMDRLQAQARNIEAAARGALQLAAAFKIVDESTASMLQNVAQLAANVPALSAAIRNINTPGGAGVAGVVGAALPIAGAIAGLVGSLMAESPAEAAMREALKKNAEAIVVLTRQIGEFGLQISGNQFVGVQRAVQDTLSSGSHFALHPLRQVPNLNPETALQRLNLSLADLQRVAEELHITFAGTLPTMEELRQLAAALAQTELTQFANTATGQLEALRHEFEVFDITDPIEQLRRLQQVLAGGNLEDASRSHGYGSPALAGALGGDLTTAAGRAAAEAALQELFRQLQNGTLAAGALGGLTPDQFLQSLLDALKMLRDADASMGGQTNNYGVNRTITEVTGSRLASLLTTDAYWNEQTAHHTEAIASLLDQLCANGSVMPPTMGELNRYMGGVSGLTLSVVVQVSGPVSGDNAQSVGEQVGAAVVQAVNRELGAQQRARVRSFGDVTLRN